MSTLYEVLIRAPSDSEPGGRSVTMKEMGTEDLLMAFRTAGQGIADSTGANLQTKLAALRLCVVEDNGEPLTYAQLQGARWDDRFSLKESFILAAAWSRVHEPTQEDVDGLGGLVRVKSGA